MQRENKINCDLKYSIYQLRSMFTYADQHDVENCGIYDKRSAVINVWSHPWTTTALRNESTVMCSFYVDWMLCTIRTIEYDMDLEIAYDELAKLEKGSFGQVVHGVLINGD